ncbi:isochorismate synthase [Aureibaculum marinum]|uniref:isochorismate synthase n=1 Tax=Aureibaculum marinum TaxID=2487930 RepID=A0A3N4P156_9FLAO|nr:chorismate-binding protein [Aureibaculum marinum]RPE00878.1 isochorismate synthase [Aureibaculum marinum]
MNDVDFYKKIKKVYANKLPFVVYSKPDSAEVKLIVQKNDKIHYTEDYKESGFVFAPFENDKLPILFPISESISYTNSFSAYGKEITRNKPDTIFNSSTSSKNKHVALVEKGIKFLENNNYKKVVLSRKEIIKYEEFELVQIYRKLLKSYSNAFVYSWYHPKVGLWLGASPEVLLEADKNSFRTMALASTQVYDVKKYGEFKSLKDVNIHWGAKEVAEQQHVTDYIIEQLNVHVKVSKPYTTKAGNLLHIRTDISGKLTEQLTLKKIVNLLHPTPAVCGVPKEKAKEFIVQNENYSRQFYTGFLGELNLNNKSALFVNLRCMQFVDNTLEIYIGGGITVDSNPVSEWEETVNKSKVMMKVL